MALCCETAAPQGPYTGGPALPAGPPLLVRLNARLPGIPAAFLSQLRSDLLQATAAGLGAVVTENMSFRLPEILAATPVPLPALVGERELCLLRACGRDLARTLPGAGAYLRARLSRARRIS